MEALKIIAGCTGGLFIVVALTAGWIALVSLVRTQPYRELITRAYRHNVGINELTAIARRWGLNDFGDLILLRHDGWRALGVTVGSAMLAAGFWMAA